MRRTRLITGPRILTAIVLGVIAAALFLALRKPAVEVELGTVGRGPLVVTVGDRGETRVHDLFVVSAPVSGELLRVPLKPGDAVVAQRTLLARIRPAEPSPMDARTLAQTQANIQALDAQVGAADQRVAQAQATAAQAERDYARLATLSGRGFVSRANLEVARTARDQARQAIAEARALAGAARHSLEATRASLIAPQSGHQGRGEVAVTSPVSGSVLTVPQESERFVVAGTPLVQLGDPQRLEFVVELLSADAVRVQPGDPVLLEDWGGDRPLRGRVRLVEPFGFLKISALGVEEQRVNVIVEFAEPRSAWGRLGHGYRAIARIVVWSAPDVVRVPVGALFRSGSDWAVYAVGADGRAHLKRIALGPMNDDFALVRSGLGPGERVILHPGERVSDGVRVSARAP